VIEDNFTKTEANFSIADEFKNVQDILASDFKKTNTKLKVTADPMIPNKVRASQQSFRQILWNLV
jgi:signal transduction histidine kinase